MPEVDPWEAYFYPETIDAMGQGTLRNKYGLRDSEALRFTEYGMTARRARQLRTREVLIPQTYDEAHVRALHGHLFQDVYEWAGQLRTVDMAKGPKGFFANAEQGARDIPEALHQMTRSVGAVDWRRANRSQFFRGIAETFAWLNHAHPFREGNGRVTKEFLHNVAAQSPRFALDFERLPPDAWNHYSDLSRPNPGERTPHPEEMCPVFRRLMIDRPDGGRGAGPTGPTRSPLLDVSSPSPATDATRQTSTHRQESMGNRLSRWLHRDRGPGERER